MSTPDESTPAARGKSAPARGSGRRQRAAVDAAGATSSDNQGDVMDEKGNQTNTHLHAPAVVEGRHGGTLKPIRSTERSLELHRARAEKKARAIRAGVADAVPKLNDEGAKLGNGEPLKDAYDALRYVATQNTLNAADPSAPGSQRSLDLVLKHGWPEPPKQDGPTYQQNNQVNLIDLLLPEGASGADKARLAQELLADLRQLRSGKAE